MNRDNRDLYELTDVYTSIVFLKERMQNGWKNTRKGREEMQDTLYGKYWWKWCSDKESIWCVLLVLLYNV